MTLGSMKFMLTVQAFVDAQVSLQWLKGMKSAFSHRRLSTGQLVG